MIRFTRTLIALVAVSIVAATLPAAPAVADAAFGAAGSASPPAVSVNPTNGNSSNAVSGSCDGAKGDKDAYEALEWAIAMTEQRMDISDPSVPGRESLSGPAAAAIGAHLADLYLMADKVSGYNCVSFIECDADGVVTGYVLHTTPGPLNAYGFRETPVGSTVHADTAIIRHSPSRYFPNGSVEIHDEWRWHEYQLSVIPYSVLSAPGTCEPGTLINIDTTSPAGLATCLTGYDVWRFYQTGADTGSAAWTFSRINADTSFGQYSVSNCDDKINYGLFHPNHADSDFTQIDAAIDSDSTYSTDVGCYEVNRGMDAQFSEACMITAGSAAGTPTTGRLLTTSDGISGRCTNHRVLDGARLTELASYLDNQAGRDAFSTSFATYEALVGTASARRIFGIDVSPHPDFDGADLLAAWSGVDCGSMLEFFDPYEAIDTFVGTCIVPTASVFVSRLLPDGSATYIRAPEARYTTNFYATPGGAELDNYTQAFLGSPSIVVAPDFSYGADFAPEGLSAAGGQAWSQVFAGWRTRISEEIVLRAFASPHDVPRARLWGDASGAPATASANAACYGADFAIEKFDVTDVPTPTTAPPATTVPTGPTPTTAPPATTVPTGPTPTTAPPTTTTTAPPTTTITLPPTTTTTIPVPPVVIEVSVDDVGTVDGSDPQVGGELTPNEIAADIVVECIENCHLLPADACIGILPGLVPANAWSFAGVNGYSAADFDADAHGIGAGMLRRMVGDAARFEDASTATVYTYQASRMTSTGLATVTASFQVDRLADGSIGILTGAGCDIAWDGAFEARPAAPGTEGANATADIGGVITSHIAPHALFWALVNKFGFFLR